MNMIHSNCTDCGHAIMVHHKEFSDVDAHLCVTCTPSFEEELETIFCNEELDFSDLPDGWLASERRTLPKTCECGALKASTPFHSSWCPLYHNPMTAALGERA